MSSNQNTVLQALETGVAGACTLTFIHETARRLLPNAPRLDTLGRRAIVRAMEKMRLPSPSEGSLQGLALTGDILFNSLYYSFVGVGSRKSALLRGSLLGLGAGLGAVFLPKYLGLGAKPTNRTPATKAMSVAWYVAGGLAAAATSMRQSDPIDRQPALEY